MNNISKSTIYKKPITDNAQDKFANHPEISQYIKEVKASTKDTLQLNNDKPLFTKSDKLEAIVNESDVNIRVIN